MPLTKNSQKILESFFDSYDISYKPKLNKSILINFYNIYYKSIQLYKKKYKFKLKKTVSEINSQVFKNDLIKSKYMDINCKTDILENSKGILNISVNINGVQVYLEFMIFNNEDYGNLNKYDLYIEKVISFLIFIFHFSKKKNPSSIKYYLFLCKYQKNIPKNTLNVLSGKNCNTGITYGCAKNGQVLIYREEEWFKVLIHETFHLLCLDFNNMYLDNFNNKFKSIININSKYNLFESYTEFWATFLNSVYTATKLSGKKKDNKNFLRYFDFCLNYERIFSLFQCVKVLDHMGLTYKNLISKDEISLSLKKLYYKENTNVFAYYVIKMILLYFNNDFVNWCKKNNINNIFNFNKNEKSLDSFIDFIKKFMYNKKLMKDMDKSLKLLEKNKGENNKFLIETLRMTVIEI